MLGLLIAGALAAWVPDSFWRAFFFTNNPTLAKIEFDALGIIPQNRTTAAFTEGIQWNYTTILNIIFLILAAALVIRFIRTGGIPMLRMMNKPAQEMAHHEM